MPLVSICLPSYNHGAYIKECIDSILAQTHQEWQLIIVDDCSNDDSFQIIQSYSDHRIYTYRNKINMGAETTLNECIKHAKGEFIAIINSDDSWYPQKLEFQIKALQNADICFTNAKIIGEDSLGPFGGNPKWDRIQWLQQLYYNGNCLCHSSVLVKKEVYEKVGLYNPQYTQLPDYDMWVRMLVAGFKITLLEDKLVSYRIHDTNVSKITFNNIFRNAIERAKILEHYFDLPVYDISLLFNYKEIIDEKYKPYAMMINLPKDPVVNELMRNALWNGKIQRYL